MKREAVNMHIASVILLTLGLSVNAQTINVRGKVTNAASNAIANAVLELTHAKLKDTTGADGLYALNSGGAAVRPFAHPASGSMRLKQGVLEFSVAEAAPIRIGIFDVKGTLLDKVALNRASAGTYRLNLAGRIHSDNLLVVKVSIGEQSKVFSCLPMARGRAADAGLVYLGPSGSLAKERTFVDTLKATATGYQTKTFALASYDLAQDILLETSANCTPPTPPSAKDSVTLDMAVAEGAPNYLASGFIYGISQDGVQPPTPLLTDIKVKGFRAGRGSGGCGEAAWKAHWKVIKGYYSKAKEMGVPMLILVSDDYQYDCPLPGEGGDWTTFTTFMGQLIDSVKANGMTGSDVRWELWNEADYNVFWKGTQAQWLDTWKHAYQQVRAALPSAVIEGPSLSSGAGGSWSADITDRDLTQPLLGRGGIVDERFPRLCQDQQRHSGLHQLAHSRRGGRSGQRRGHDRSRAFDPRHHGRERFRPQRIREPNRAEPGPLRLVSRAIRSGGDPGHAFQLVHRTGVLREHGEPRDYQLAAEQPVLDLQAVRGPDRPPD
jgi:hypothetical protein